MTPGAESQDRYEEGRRLLASGRHQEAVASLQPLVAADPRDAEAHALLGVALGMQGETVESLRHLETATQLAPQQPSYFFNLGQVRERSGDTPAAIAAYRQALQIHPHYARASEAVARLAGAPAQPVPTSANFGAPAVEPARATAPWLDPQYAARLAEGSRAAAVDAGPKRLVDAPQIVKSIRWLYVLCIFLMLLGLLGMIAGVGEAGQSLADTVGGAAIAACLLMLYGWLLVAVPRGDRPAYYVQLVLAVIGLLGFPVGTLINGYILYHWVQPDTKAWFGVT